MSKEKEVIEIPMNDGVVKVNPYSEFWKKNWKIIAVGVAGIAVGLTINSCSPKNDAPPVAEKPIETVQPVPTDNVDVVEDMNESLGISKFNVSSMAADVERIKAATDAQNFSLSDIDIYHYLAVQNLDRTDDEDLAEINKQYFNNELDIDEVIDNSFGVIAQIRNGNMNNTANEFMSYNYCYDPLDYFIINELENQYLEVRKIVESNEASTVEKNIAIGTWLVKMADFYDYDVNKTGLITLNNGNELDGSWNKASLSAGGNFVADSLGQEIAMWVNKVYNTQLRAQLDLIVDTKNRDLQVAINTITNSSFPKEELVTYINENKDLTEEEIVQLKLAVSLYEPFDFTSSIAARADHRASIKALSGIAISCEPEITR